MSVSKEIAILWDLDQGKPYGNPIGPLENKLRTAVGFHPHGKILGHSFYDSKNFVLRSREGLEDYGVTIHHRGIITSIAFSPDGTILATGSFDKTVKLTNIKSTLLMPRQSKWMAVGYEGEDLESESGNTPSYDKNLLCPPLAGHSDHVNSVAFSPGGKTLASGSDDQTVILWNTVTCTRIGLPLKSHNGRIKTVAFSSKGDILASGSDDRAIVLWDVDTLTRRGKALTGHSGNVYSLSFSPEGTVLASADADGTILLWDVETQQRLGKPLRGHSGAVYSVRFSPDGKTLAAAGTDTRISLWDSSYESWRTRGCRIANRNLTKDEWRVYLTGEERHKTCLDIP